MTEEEFNRTLKELDVVLHDIDYNKFETSFDVAKFIITLNKINERMILEEKEELEAKLKGFENGEVAWQGDMDRTIHQNLELKNKLDTLRNYFVANLPDGEKVFDLLIN